MLTYAGGVFGLANLWWILLPGPYPIPIVHSPTPEDLDSVEDRAIHWHRVERSALMRQLHYVNEHKITLLHKAHRGMGATTALREYAASKNFATVTRGVPVTVNYLRFSTIEKLLADLDELVDFSHRPRVSKPWVQGTLLVDDVSFNGPQGEHVARLLYLAALHGANILAVVNSSKDSIPDFIQPPVATVIPMTGLSADEAAAMAGLDSLSDTEMKALQRRIDSENITVSGWKSMVASAKTAIHAASESS